ncbi:uncharacterized protein TRIVIDRAFT_184401 [Trichoderma virens Gv29-8]|uniref:RRM domain-containing protein n=1 Tax=Hypocrea virens (strain Gv29-8 / FGSC 10586) TaxID=413071 RepID=G9NAT7_HYPVG|nr:uncharacterized protein TRIVIDRAFT_184401 [Trichoderma virens Gv29-8]EHK15948.1 hypothetical protein TRIVIDRAFT_184401 [Trichoderma virens Gv29-8]
MSTHTPQVLSRRTNAPASESTKKQAEARSTNDADPPKAPKTRTPHEGEKVIIRRLPPGMTEAECLSILGSEWAVGSGKVDWFSYAPGKASNELSKPSRPARAYLHVMRKDYIMPLSEVVRSATWEDAKCTFNSSSLIGPPALEMSIYKKVPGTKKRVDARQGTIDQDPEFMAFLEGLANPAPPREGIENEDVEEAPETKVTTTPLIEYLKEKKANKAKEAAAAKSAKHSRQETTTTKGKSASKEDEGSKKKGKDSKNTKTEKPAPKEPVKILTKKAAATASEKSAEAAKPAASQASTSGNAASTTEAPTPKSRRAGVSIAARMLQRDLGLSPGSAYRRARQDAAKAEAGSKSSATDKENKEISSAANENQSSLAPASTETATSAQTPAKENASKAQQPARKTRGGKNADKPKPSEASGGQNTNITPPVILKKKSGASGDADASKSTAETASATQQSNSKSASGAANGPKGASAKSSGSQKKSAAAASANATRGFVKHANSSQGITEPVLKQALEAFGTITFIEVDKRKGFAYVDFADHSGLAKAISASPISVAQGTVQVLERKDKKPAPASSGSGNAAATPSASNTASNGAAPEKSSGTGRGRRGRGGKAATATSGTPIAATSGG